MKKYLFIASLILLSACNDTSITKLYDKNFSNPSCMRLFVFPPDTMIENTMNELYTFENNCDYTLQVSKKGGITCNSTHNASKKTTSNFPSGYLKMDITEGGKNIYSYYIDLKNTPTKDDIENAFVRVKKDLKIN